METAEKSGAVLQSNFAPKFAISKISNRIVRRDRNGIVPGCVLYRGQSPFLAGPAGEYVVVMTMFADNTKTGDMPQIWILCEHEHPLEAKALGHHVAVCGGCPITKLCYVNLAKRPRSVHEQYKAGLYNPNPNAYDNIVRINGVRFGAYGDPVLIPLDLVDHLAGLDVNHKHWTGYTHQWQLEQYQAYRRYFMASVHTLEEMQRAWSMGWRTFRVGRMNEQPIAGEIHCPAQTTQDLQCVDCFACNGNDRELSLPMARSVFAQPHGLQAESRWDKFLGGYNHGLD